MTPLRETGGGGLKPQAGRQRPTAGKGAASRSPAGGWLSALSHRSRADLRLKEGLWLKPGRGGPAVVKGRFAARARTKPALGHNCRLLRDGQGAFNPHRTVTIAPGDFRITTR